MRLAAGDRAGAAEAFAAAARSDPTGRLGADLRLAALEGRDAAMPPAYVAALFDDYAPRFEKHLLDTLGYVGPPLMRDALIEAGAIEGRPKRVAHAIDLGCGTGLLAADLGAMAERVSGVDLSARMIAKARATGHYHRLVVAEMVAFLAAEPAGGADLLVALDAAVYLGDLSPFFVAAAGAAARGALLAFTLQRLDPPTARWRLAEDLRYWHAPPYVSEALAAAGWRVAIAREVSTRKDRGEPVPGLLVVAARP
jgi:predicted TPR repeat methyltransferase